MNALAVTCRLLCRISQRCYIIHNRSLVRTSCKVRTKLLIGLVPIVPSVYAQSDIKSDAKATPEPIKDVGSTKEESSNPAKEDDGWERVCAIFMKDEFGNPSKEMSAVTQIMSFSFLAGLVFGGVNESRIAFVDFMERNQASIFENHLDAKRRLQNHVTIHFGKGALRWGIRLTLFTGGFTLFLTSMSAYRGHSSLMDYVVSGGLVGGLVRCRLGPPALAIGGLLGAFLGLFCGLTTHGLLELFETDLDEVIAFQYELDRKRQKLYKDIEKSTIENSLNSPEALNLIKTREVGKDSKGI